MTSSSEDTENQPKVHLCQVGANFYQGQVLNGKTFGFGTLFDQDREQFIIGLFKDNHLIEIQTAQFTSCHFRKFRDCHVFECEQQNFLAQIIITCNNIDISDPFGKIFKEICLGSKILKVYEDDLSEKVLEFCKALQESSLMNIDWNKVHGNKPLEFFEFYQLLMKFQAKNESVELIRQIGGSPIIFGDMCQKRAALNNEIVRREQIFKFANVIFKYNLFELIKEILEKVCENYRICLMLQDQTLEYNIASLDFPSVFLLRLRDIKTLVRADKKAKSYDISFEIDNIFQTFNKKGKIPGHVAAPVIISCYPDLLKALGYEMKTLSEELKMSYEKLFDDIIVQWKPLNTNSKQTLNFYIAKYQILFLRELLNYFKPGDSLKKKLYSGPHEDYSIHSEIIQAKTIDFYNKSFKGKISENVRIWYDLLDLNIVTIFFYYRGKKPSVTEFFKNFMNQRFESLQQYEKCFRVYSILVVEIFERTFTGEKIIKRFSLFHFVRILTDIMNLIARDLHKISSDPEKSEVVKNVLRTPLGSQANVLDHLDFIAGKLCIKIGS